MIDILKSGAHFIKWTALFWQIIFLLGLLIIFKVIGTVIFEKMHWKKNYKNGCGPWFDILMQKTLSFLDGQPFEWSHLTC